MYNTLLYQDWTPYNGPYTLYPVRADFHFFLLFQCFFSDNYIRREGVRRLYIF